MGSHEKRANEMLRAVGGSMAVWSQRNVLIRMILAEDKVDDLQQEIERLNRLIETLSRALGRYQDEEVEVGGDDPADHPYQRRCFCPCHEFPGTYPPPCGYCGHDTRQGTFPGSVREGWTPNAG